MKITMITTISVTGQASIAGGANVRIDGIDRRCADLVPFGPIAG